MHIQLPKRFKLLFDFSIWFLLFSLFLRVVFIVWQFSEIKSSAFSLLKTAFYGVFFDLGVLSFVWFISSLYLLVMPRKWIGSKLDKVVINFFFTLTVLIFVFTFFAEITFWDEYFFEKVSVPFPSLDG